MLKMEIGFRRFLLVVTAAGFVACCAFEVLHHHRFGHFARPGLHTDVIVGNSDIGTQDMHYARLLNFSLTPFRLEGCKFASDVIGVPDAIMPRWDVQKRDAASGRWFSLRGADTWVPDPFGGYWKEEPCRAAILHFAPFQSRNVAWVYKDWVTTGDPVRMAIHTSVSKPAEKQGILYTDSFVVKSARK